jgi:diguanylate cyclase (GGDEF)-like protein
MRLNRYSGTYHMMNMSFLDKNAKNEAGADKQSIGKYKLRASELTELLSACRNLSDILDSEELYATFAGIIKNRFAVHELGIFVYEPEEEIFSLVFSYGLGKLEYNFKTDKQELWHTILEDQPFTVVDETGNPLFAKVLKKQDFKILPSDLWIPMVMRDEVMGLLTLGAKADAHAFDDFDLYFLKQIAAQAAVSINTCKQYDRHRQEKEDLDKTLQNLSLLYGIGKAMNYINDLKTLLQYILKQAIEIAAAEKGSLMLYDIESDRLHIRVLAGMEDTDYQDRVNNNQIKCRSFKPGEGIAGRVYSNSMPMTVNNIREDSLFIASDTSFVRSIACIPMVVYNDVIGVINVTNKKNGKKFTNQDIKMLNAVADQAAAAVNKAQLWDLAVTDSLTGLYVRRYFLVKLNEEIHRADRSNRIISVIMADLDNFKDINDTYGHDAGDRALEAISHFLQKSIRDVDAIARYGGEEFVMLIPDADKGAAFRLAERLRKKLAKVKLENMPPITVSLGIATFPADGRDVEGLIKKADAAMYAAKQAGRNNSVKYADHIPLIRNEDRA